MKLFIYEDLNWVDFIILETIILSASRKVDVKEIKWETDKRKPIGERYIRVRIEKLREKEILKTVCENPLIVKINPPLYKITVALYQLYQSWEDLIRNIKLSKLKEKNE